MTVDQKIEWGRIIAFLALLNLNRRRTHPRLWRVK